MTDTVKQKRTDSFDKKNERRRKKMNENKKAEDKTKSCNKQSMQTFDSIKTTKNAHCMVGARFVVYITLWYHLSIFPLHYLSLYTV